MRLLARVFLTSLIPLSTMVFLPAQQTQPEGPVRIEVKPANPSVLQGTSQQFSASSVFIGGVNKAGAARSINGCTKWSSSQSNIASISLATGLAQALNLGTTEITATCGPFRGSTLLTVHGIACGDGIRDGSEQCDDGNTTNLDACSATCNFEQDLRINSLTMQFGTDTTCTANRLGSAIASTAQGPIQTVITNDVNTGALSSLFAMLGISDLTGTNEASFQMGVLSGTPAAAPSGTTYNGSSDLDWWYTPDPAAIDGNRVPVSRLNASIAAKALSAGPGEILFPSVFGNATVNLTMSNTVIKGTIGSASTPTVSSNAATPGHVAGEHLDPALTSYSSVSAGSLCSGIRAASLANVPIPASLVTGAAACTEGYVASDSMLDALVGGCHVLAGLVTAINPTQPDTNDPTMPAAGAGSPYTLIETSHHVSSCKDKNGTVVSLSTCLNAAAYSSYFKFTMDRVIIK